MTTPLAKTNFDKILQGVSMMLVPGTAAFLIKKIYRSNRV